MAIAVPWQFYSAQCKRNIDIAKEMRKQLPSPRWFPSQRLSKGSTLKCHQQQANLPGKIP